MLTVNISNIHTHTTAVTNGLKEENTELSKYTSGVLSQRSTWRDFIPIHQVFSCMRDTIPQINK